jgi:hypothetical protein
MAILSSSSKGMYNSLDSCCLFDIHRQLNRQVYNSLDSCCLFSCLFAI